MLGGGVKGALSNDYRLAFPYGGVLAPRAYNCKYAHLRNCNNYDIFTNHHYIFTTVPPTSL